jgi:hypothetical protein
MLDIGSTGLSFPWILGPRAFDPGMLRGRQTAPVFRPIRLAAAKSDGNGARASTIEMASALHLLKRAEEPGTKTKRNGEQRAAPAAARAILHRSYDLICGEKPDERKLPRGSA